MSILLGAGRRLLLRTTSRHLIFRQTAAPAYFIQLRENLQKLLHRRHSDRIHPETFTGGNMVTRYKLRLTAAYALAAVLLAAPLASVVAQTRVSMPKNKYKVQDDVRIGRDAARKVEQQFPILNDTQVQNYVATVGERVDAAYQDEVCVPN